MQDTRRGGGGGVGLWYLGEEHDNVGYPGGFELLLDLGHHRWAALAAKRAEDEAKLLGLGGARDGVLPHTLHVLRLVPLLAQYLSTAPGPRERAGSEGGGRGRWTRAVEEGHLLYTSLPQPKATAPVRARVDVGRLQQAGGARGEAGAPPTLLYGS